MEAAGGEGELRIVPEPDEDAEVTVDGESGDLRSVEADEEEDVLWRDLAVQLGLEVDDRGVGRREGDPDCTDDDDLRIGKR